MASYNVSVVLDVVREHVIELESLLGNRFRKLRVVNEIKAVGLTVGMMGAFVRVAEERKSADQSAKFWLKQVNDVAYDAEALLDELITKLRLDGLEAEISGGDVHPCSLLCAVVKQTITLIQTAAETKQIHSMVRDVLERGSLLGLGLGLHGAGVTARAVRQLPTTSFVFEQKIYGRDHEEQDIMRMLLTPDGKRGDGIDNLSVIAIVGVGGIGKTTLAQSVYNDDRVLDYFQLRIWVCASDEFDVARISRTIIESITGQNCEFSHMGLLQTRIHELLTGKRFLLVLDDVWNEDFHKADMIFRPLLRGEPGSKVLVTTRSLHVAHAMRIKKPFTLKGLSKDACWSLFSQWAFAGEAAENFPTLVKIGKDIAGQCQGIPLAAKALGGLLFSTREESYWNHIKNTGISSFPEDEHGIITVLKLSYDHLPPRLKECFRYCCLYPKDTDIDVEDLIQQWMANGFIDPSEDKPMEDVGYQYLYDLLWRSLFLDITEDRFGEIKQCKMLNPVHDVAQSVAMNEYLVTRSESINTSYFLSVRHLTAFDTIPEDTQKLTNLRTFSYNGCEEIPTSVLHQIFSTLKLLRVLNLSKVCAKKLPDSICNLIHLRYLKLGHFQSLPESIGKLINLQTLDFGKCAGRLPRDFSQLKRLRYLNLHFMEGEGCSSPNIGELTHLRKLVLSWANSAKNMDEVLEGLRPLENLKYLKLNNYPCENLSSWLMDSTLSSLAHLALYNCGRCEILRLLWRFPSLKLVSMERMESVKHLEFSISECPLLETLALSYMCNLEKLLQGDKDHRNMIMRNLRISDCPRLTSVELVRSLQLNTLSISNCPRLDHLPIVSSVKDLRLCNCDAWILESVESLPSISSLIIENFMELERLPEMMSPRNSSLEKLEIINCPNIKLEGLHCPATVKSLVISGCKKLGQLPLWLQSLHCLENLELCNLGDDFTHLPEWLVKLPLRSLKLFDLEHLAYLPTECRGVQHLEIQNCLGLVERDKTQDIP